LSNRPCRPSASSDRNPWRAEEPNPPISHHSSPRPR
jgi:hypothetical protein